MADDWRGVAEDDAASVLFAGEGEMAARCRLYDWASSPLGPVESWPQELRVAVRLTLDAPLPSALCCGPDDTLLYNDAYTRLLGTRHPAALGRPGAAVWPEVWNCVEPQVAAVRARGESIALEDMRFVVDREDGGPEEAWFTYAVSPVREEGTPGAPGGVLAVLNQATETTARVRAEAALAAERERLREVVYAAPAPIALHVGPDHVYALVNDAYRRISGGGRDVTGLPAREAFPDLASHALFDVIDRVYATGEAWGAPETPLRYDRDGTGVQDTWYNLRFEPVRDARDRVIGVLNFSFDVTAQVHARQEVERLLGESEATRRALVVANAELEAHRLALETTNRRLQDVADELTAQAAVAEETHRRAEAEHARSDAVLASIADPFYLLDREWRFIFVNDAAEPLLQTTRESLLGRTLWEAFPDVVGSPFEGPYREAMAGGRPTVAEAYFAPLGSWFDVRSYPWGDGLMVHFRDIGAQKSAEAERERLLADAEAARVEAEAANRAKGDFLAVMSHELRTPLNAIAGYAELIELGIHGPVTDAQRTALARIQKSQRHLLGLINGVLNYSRAEAGAVHYELRDVALGPVLATCETLIAPQAHAKQISLHVESCDDALAVHVDVEKLQQIVTNLLSNAVKFTAPAGSVTLACRLSRFPNGTDGVVITVSDTGRGISADALERIFEPFVQVDARLTRNEEGVGLGLAISRDLARGMGGDITVESALGAGSTFALTLPRA